MPLPMQVKSPISAVGAPISPADRGRLSTSQGEPVTFCNRFAGRASMKRLLMMSAGLLSLALVPGYILAQPVANPPANQVNDPTGTPPGVMPMQNRNSVGFPAPHLVEGQPIEMRAPEKE